MQHSKTQAIIAVDYLVRVILYTDYTLNEDLLEMVMVDIKRMEYGEEYLVENYMNKNLIKREILILFKNVTDLHIICDKYPFSLESLLSLITGTQIRKVQIEQGNWLAKAKLLYSSTDIVDRLSKANYKMTFGSSDENLNIEYAS